MNQLDMVYDKLRTLRYSITEADIRYCGIDGIPKHLLNTQEQELINFILNMIKEEQQW